MSKLRRIAIISASALGILIVAIVDVRSLRAATTARLIAEQTDTITLTVGGRQRRALLHVPANVSKEKPLPLVFVFHGGSGTAKNMLGLTHFHEVADREGFLVVFPQGIGNGWNDGRVTQVSQAHREQVDDLAFFDALLVELMKTHRVDPQRVFATGISNGGMFSHYLAANRAEKIAAIAPVVGGITIPFNERFKPTHPVSVLIIQGSEDPLVPYGGGKVAASRTKDRGSIIATDEAVNLWVKVNGCQPAAAPTLLSDTDPKDGCRTEVTRWQNGRDGTDVWLYRVKGGGHTWPSGPNYLPAFLIGRVTHDFGSQAIWDFFTQHPKSASTP